MPVHDLILRAGRVVDGRSDAPRTADIAVRDGVIAEIGRVRDRAHRVIDADGALVHAGLVALLPPEGVADFDRNRQHHLAPGVTTTIEQLPQAVDPEEVPRFLQKSAGSQFLVDRGFLLPHNGIRQCVMGNKVRDHLAPSAGDLEQMAKLLADGLIAGALGLVCTLAGEPDELRHLIDQSIEQIDLRTELDVTTTVFIDAPGLDPGELLEAGRYLARSVGVGAVVIATEEPLDDDRVISAVRRSSGDAPLIELQQEPTVIAGPGMNPLCFVHEFGEIDRGFQRVALGWAASASSFGLHDRGLIATDRRADLNVLDLAHLNQELTDGVVSTLVAGSEIVSFDELTGSSPGRVVFRSATEPD